MRVSQPPPATPRSKRRKPAQPLKPGPSTKPNSPTITHGASKDVPETATAIFPPTEVQSWPANNYRDATTFYLDSLNRTVNTAAPSGAITTTEYVTTTNNVERTLTADNRQVALKETGNTAEAAELLSTEDTYNSEGTERTSTLGPQHIVKLANGTQIAARKRTQYTYEEGAPAGGPYDLVTTTSEGAVPSGVGQEEKEKRTVKVSYGGQENLGWKLHAPTSTTTSVGGRNLVASTVYEPSTGLVKESTSPNGRTESHIARSYTPFGKAGAEAGEFNAPSAVVVGPGGGVWVADTNNNRIDEFGAAGTFIKAFGWGVEKGKEKLEVCTTECKAGVAGAGKGQLSAPQGITYDSANGNLYVSDTGNNRIIEFTTAGKEKNTFGTKGAGELQFNSPRGLAAEANGDIWIADHGNDRLEEITEKGGYVGVADQKANAAFSDVTVCHGAVFATNYSGQSIFEVQPENEHALIFGGPGNGPGQFNQISSIACDPENKNLYVTDQGSDKIDVFTTTGRFVEAFGTAGSEAGQFKTPVGIAFSTAGIADVVDSANSRVQEVTSTDNTAAYTTQTIYYSAGANTTYPACGEHPQWASLVCQEQPAGQPETPGLPDLPVTTLTYNIWDEPVSTTDTVESTEPATNRTTTVTYDGAGRPLTTAIKTTPSTDVALPTVSDEYSAETGALIKQSTTTEGHTKAVISVYNSLSQLTSYTDAEGNVAKYEYEKEADYRPTKVTDGEGTAAASNQTYAYNTITGELVSVKDSAAGTFTATRDVEGNITAKGYPNGTNANYTYNQVGEPVALEYVKTTHCSSGCTWYTDTVLPSIHGQWMSQTSSLSQDRYEYDELGRLTTGDETNSGGEAWMREYAYDEDGNRTNEVFKEPGKSVMSQSYVYDTADRLEGSGVSYDPFGNITSLPAADVGGAAVTSTYYVDNSLASQEQNGEKISYNLDPAGRPSETISTGATNATVIAHYAGPVEAPAWTINKASGSWTRNVLGVDGGLAAIQTGEGTVLQLADLHGDIIGTAADNEIESKLVPTSETNEFGVPHTTVSAKYSWRGADQSPAELPTGIINMGARTYIPELGRFEQTDPQPGGSINAYAYAYDNPVNEADPSGEWASTITYNYEDGHEGTAEAGLPEHYAAPGAITPPPADLQAEAEFAADPPWDAAYTFTIMLGGGGHGVHAARLSFGKAFAAVKHIVGATIEGAAQQIRTKTAELWDAVNSVIFQQAYECIDGADELAAALDAEEWQQYPVFEATVSLIGCSGALQGADYGGSAKTGQF